MVDMLLIILLSIKLTLRDQEYSNMIIVLR